MVKREMRMGETAEATAALLVRDGPKGGGPLVAGHYLSIAPARTTRELIALLKGPSADVRARAALVLGQLPLQSGVEQTALAAVG